MAGWEAGLKNGDAENGGRPASLDRVLHALGDPVRLGIVRQLARDGESSCAALNGNRSKSTMSHHFRVLREAGLVQTRNQGVTHMNTLCRDTIDARYPGLLSAVIQGCAVDADADT